MAPKNRDHDPDRPVPTSPNAHANHPERLVEKCPWARCGRMHLPYTKVAREHRAKAIRAAGRRLDEEDLVARALYMQVREAPDMRTARKAAADLWRAMRAHDRDGRWTADTDEIEPSHEQADDN